MKKSKRELVLEEAAKLFVEKGYSATSMKDIAVRNGIEAASLYNHIKSKQDILQDLLLSIAYKFDAGIKNIASSKFRKEERLKEAIKMHINVSVNNQDTTYLILQDWKHLEEPSKSEFLEIRKYYQDTFRDLIVEAKELDVVRNANTEIMLNNILSSLRWIYNQDLYDNVSKIDLSQFESEMLQFIFSGIKK